MQPSMLDLCRSIRANVDLVTVVSQDTPLRRSGPNEWQGRNPFHGGDNPRGLTVYYDHRSDAWKFKCFTGANHQGDVLDYIQIRDGIELPAVIDRLRGGIGDWRQREPVATLPPDERSSPLAWALVERYERLLDVPVDPTGKNQTTPRELWRRHGMDDETIARFRLGYCPACPTAYDEANPDRRFPSLTIPVIFNGELLTIRHRLLTPIDIKDKYRPHRKGAGLYLFNRDGLSRESPDVLIVEGEKKAMVLCRLGVDTLMPVVSATGGVKAWLGRYRGVWAPLLADRSAVYVLFDPGSEETAERTAYLFGRRGHVVTLPEKVDDMMLARADPYDGLPALFDAIGAAVPVRSRSYWGERLAAREVATLPVEAPIAQPELRDRSF